MGEAGTQDHKAVCAEGMGNGYTGSGGVAAGHALGAGPVLGSSHISSLLMTHLSPKTQALLLPCTDGDLEAQRQGVTSPVSSPIYTPSG